jgi:hypothetical protein
MRRRRWLRALTLLLALLLGAAGAAHAEDLDALKARGVLGEQADGYVGVVDANATAAQEAFAREVNAKRRAHYERIAAENGTPVEAVAQLAGEKLIAKAPSGQYIRRNGGWVKK